MPTRYIELDYTKFDTLMRDNGFSYGVFGKEIVYSRQHHLNKNLWVKVYSSFSIGADVARECGGDAIRVVAIYDDGAGKSFGLYKAERTYRTGSQEAVQQRVYDRMKLAYKKLNEWNKAHR